jgi:hypothetical protein
MEIYMTLNMAYAFFNVGTPFLHVVLTSAQEQLFLTVAQPQKFDPIL